METKCYQILSDGRKQYLTLVNKWILYVSFDVKKLFIADNLKIGSIYCDGNENLKELKIPKNTTVGFLSCDATLKITNRKNIKEIHYTYVYNNRLFVGEDKIN